MKVVNVHEAKTSLSKLLAAVARGEEVTIAKAGRPVAKLVPLKTSTKRVPGMARGFTLDDSFWDPLPPEELSRWE
jgi:prevent-host-death family protein